MRYNWTVKYTNEFLESYYSSTDNSKYRHLNYDEWEVPDYDVFVSILKDLLDVPEAEVSLDQIKKDFGSLNDGIDEKKYVLILNYYNGRLALFNKIKDDMSELRCIDKITRLEFNYDIPAEYNSFSVDMDESELMTGRIDVIFEAK